MFALVQAQHLVLRGRVGALEEDTGRQRTRRSRIGHKAV